MVEVVLIILRQNTRFLLVQRSVSDSFGGTWTLPGGKVDPPDLNHMFAARRELLEETGIVGGTFGKFLKTTSKGYNIHIFSCLAWTGTPKPACRDISGVGWYTYEEMYSMGDSISPMTNNLLPLLAYLTQHFDRHPIC